MAVVAALLGGIVGFWTALVAFLLLDMSFLQALIVYASAGFMTSSAIIIYTLVAPSEENTRSNAAQVGVTQ